MNTRVLRPSLICLGILLATAFLAGAAFRTPARAQPGEPYLVKDITPGNNEFGPVAGINVNGTLFFYADDGIHGYELWKSNGGSAELVKDIVTGSAPSIPYIRDMTEMGGLLYFVPNDLDIGYTLWRSNGTTAGTVRVSENPSDGSWSSWGPGDLTDVNGTLFFTYGGRFSRPAQLWKSDGTTDMDGTVMLKEWGQKPFGGGLLRYLTNFNDKLFFFADDGGSQDGLWQSDGTTPTSVSAFRGTEYLTEVNDTLFFHADDGIHGRELWKSHGTGAEMVKDIIPGSGGSSIEELTGVNGTLFFSAHGILGGIRRGVDDFQAELLPENWFHYGDSGTLVTPSVVADETVPGSYSGNRVLKVDYVSVGQGGGTGHNLGGQDWHLYDSLAFWFRGTNSGATFRVILSDDPNPAVPGDSAERFAYEFKDDMAGWRHINIPWNAFFRDPTFQPDGAPNDGLTLTAVQAYALALPSGTHGAVYMDDVQLVEDVELWKSDGTADGTMLVKRIYGGIEDLTDVNGALFFRADDGNHGDELWKSDGTAAGTVMVRDIYEGSGSSSGSYLISVNGVLCFAADDGIHGAELWRSDGTEAGTMLVKDLNLGSNPSRPWDLTRVNGTLFFSADDGVHGRELWALDLGGPVPTTVTPAPTGTRTTTPTPTATSTSTPTPTVTPTPTGIAMEGWVSAESSYPIVGALVTLLRQGQVLADTVSQAPDGYYALRKPAVEDNLTIRVTLRNEQDSPPPFQVLYRGLNGPLIYVATEPFDITGASLPVWRDIVFGDQSDMVTDPMIPPADLDDLGVIYYHTQQAWQLARRLGQPLDLHPPVPIVAYAKQAKVFWYGPVTSVGMDVQPYINIEAANNSSDLASNNRPKNREWHEFGHQVMADALGNLMPDDPENCPYPGMPFADCNHMGYSNLTTTDSWDEGFAEFYAMLVGKEIAGDAQPTWYLTSNLESNYLAWQKEEYAVAGLLWDLVDPADADDASQIFDLDGVPEYAADCVEVDAQWLWTLLTWDWEASVPKSLNAPAGYGYIFDVKHLYDVLKASNIGATHSRGGALTDLEELFAAHGFFADVSPHDRRLEPAEFSTIGRAAYPEIPERRAQPLVPGSYVAFQARDAVTGAAVAVTDFTVEVRFDPPFELYNYSYDWNAAQTPGHIYFFGPDSQYSATVSVRPAAAGWVATGELTFTNAFYWERMAAQPDDHFVSHTFDVRRRPSVYLPLMVRAGGGSLSAVAAGRSAARPAQAMWTPRACLPVATATPTPTVVVSGR